MNITNGTWLALVALLCTTKRVDGNSFNPDPLILKANIFYQRPLELGPPSELTLENVEKLEENIKTDIKVIIHGFTGSRQHVSIRPLGNGKQYFHSKPSIIVTDDYFCYVFGFDSNFNSQAYMAAGRASVLLVDWSDAADLDYHSSRKAVGKVARFLGKILESFIARLEIPKSAVHVIGHSLGAHIAGGIGQYFNGTLGRVTGLDPALPLFSPQSPDSLHANAAQFVDVVHTDYPVFGDITPRGTADFYPNFGYTPQRGCEDIDIVTANSCSHNRAVLLYAESIAIPKNFPAFPCSLNSIKQRNPNACSQATMSKSGLNTEAPDDLFESETIYMGEYVPRSARGTYYLETYDTTPYGMGLYSKL